MLARWWVLAAAALLLMCAADAIDNQFPSDFNWCAASASYQVEGAVNEDGRGPTVWDTYSHENEGARIADHSNGDVACDSYHQYQKDVDLLAQLGVKYYRFSIAWSRIIPKGHYDNETSINPKGLDYYDRLITALGKVGILPMVTLFHWDTPQGIENDYDGWLGNTSVADFKAYADVVFSRFASRVPYWITFNEPWCSCMQGYSTLWKAPGRVDQTPVGGYLCSHHQLLAHAHTVKLYREKYAQLYTSSSGQHGQIGITLNSEYAVPATDSPADRAAAERYMTFMLGWYADPVYFGDYPRDMKTLVKDRLPKFTKWEKKLLKGSSDFFGFNAYTAVVVQDAPLQYIGPNQAYTWLNWEVDRHALSSHTFPNGSDFGTKAASGWLYYTPFAFQNYLEWIARRYGARVPILVTENGVSAPHEGESTTPVAQILDDKFRVAFYRGYLKAMRAAMKNGVNVKGYCAWSLLDNFEWGDGYTNRFGLTHVAFDDPQRKRTPKTSFKYLAAVIRNQEDLDHPSPNYVFALNATAAPNFDI